MSKDIAIRLKSKEAVNGLSLTITIKTLLIFSKICLTKSSMFFLKSLSSSSVFFSKVEVLSMKDIKNKK